MHFKFPYGSRVLKGILQDHERSTKVFISSLAEIFYIKLMDTQSRNKTRARA